MIRKKTKEKPKTTRICDHPDCQEPGEYRAPKDRNLRDYYWFCLKHVTEYNKNWDFYQGLSAEEIERHLQNDVAWQRPTWKLGHGGIKGNENIHDPFHIFEDVGLGMDGKHNPPQNPEQKYEKKLIEAVSFMELKFPLQPDIVKRQYKKLAKKYHPDTNKGDKESEKLFQRLTEAYHYIMERLGKL